MPALPPTPAVTFGDDIAGLGWMPPPLKLRLIDAVRTTVQRCPIGRRVRVPADFGA